MGSAARMSDGKHILLGGGSRATLHPLRQRTHRHHRARLHGALGFYSPVDFEHHLN